MERKDKKQTPVPKASSKGEYNEKGLQTEPATEHLESGNDTGITPHLKEKGLNAAETTQQQQEKQSKGDLKIPKIMESDGKEEHKSKTK